MVYKNIITMILTLIAIQSVCVATVGRFNVPIYINDDYYGEYTGTIPIVTLSIYDDKNKLMFEKEYENQEFNKGRTTFILDDKETMNALNHTSSKVGVFVPEFEEEVIVDIYEVPHARSAYVAQKVDWQGIENKPDLDALKFDHSITKDDDEVTLVLSNTREKNNTKTGLQLNHDNGNSNAFIGLKKSNRGYNHLVLESSNKLIFSVDNSQKMVISDVIEYNVPLKGNGSQLSNIPLSAVNLKDTDILAMGFLKREDMSHYLTASELVFAGSNYETSAASKIGVYDEFDNSDGITVQNVLDDLDQAISNVDITINKDEIVDIIETNGYIKNTLTESEVDTFVSNNGYASDISMTTLKTSLGDLAYKNQSEKLNLNEIHVEKLTYGTIAQDLETINKAVEYSHNNSVGLKHSGVAMMASGWIKMTKGLNELTITLPFNWEGGVINLMCNEEGDSGVRNFMDDDHSSKHFISTYHSLSHSTWDNTTVVTTIGNDTHWTINRNRDHFCNIKRVTPETFTLFGHRDWSVSVSWWVTAPSKS